jgi:hypothetical protein
MLQGRQEVPPEVRGEALSREAEELMSFTYSNLPEPPRPRRSPLKTVSVQQS